ncbi:GIN domain-containing protein [Chloroflexota bacterium]
MKKAVVAILAVTLLLSIMITGCEGVVRGSGNLETKQYNFNDFSRVDVGYAFKVEIDQSSSYSISITADDNLFEHIQVTKEGETLKIGLKRVLSLGSVTLRAKVTVPQLRGLDFSGATRGTVSGFSSTEKLEVNVSGASSLDLVDISAGDIKFEVSGASEVTGDIEAGDADFNISGASTVQLEGSAINIVADAFGASRVKMAAFSINNADIELSGASSGTVKLDGRLDADLSGASKLDYIGEPAMGTINISGGSSLSKK